MNNDMAPHPGQACPAETSPLKRLIEAHPLLFRGKLPAVFSDLTDGWYALTDKLCFDIEEMLGPEACADFEVDQIKEKYGTLRFHYQFRGRSDQHVDIVSPDGYKHLVIAPSGPAPGKAIEARLRALVGAADEASETICKTCGAWAELRVVGGRLTTLCDEHLAEAPAKRASRD